MDNAIFDYPPTNNFTESDNLLPDNAPEQANFAYHPNSDLSRHLIINHNIPCYNGMPRSINEYYYLDFFQDYKDEDSKAGIVYISFSRNITWVHIGVCVSSKNNYYALSFAVEENLQKLTTSQIYEATLKKGKIANITRYIKKIEHKSKL